jgi:serine/threonine-protein kinase
MGIVYKVYVAALEVMRAVKVLELWNMCDNQLQADHFVRRHAMEAKITAQLQHPNIVTLHHYGSFDGLPCLEMEYVEGMDLKQLICRHHPLALSLVTALGILFTRGIAHAHSRHYTLFGRRCSTIMHRDIKPANILISFEGAVKVTDFGIARPLELSLNTVANAMIGTLCYMSPEQMQGQQLDTRTDIYALGATLYELLCGQQLFPQENLVALMNARQTNSFQPLGSLRHGIPRPLISLVNSCVYPLVQQRIGSAEAILDILESVHGKLTKARPEQVVREFMRGCAATHPPANPPIR